MATRLGDTAPAFTAETAEGIVHFHESKGEGLTLVLARPADDAEAKFPDGWDAKKPYFRFVRRTS